MLKVYSVGDKKKMVISGPLKITNYKLPNGNIAQHICGKTKTLRIACTIITNYKPKRAKKTVSKTKKDSKI